MIFCKWDIKTHQMKDYIMHIRNMNSVYNSIFAFIWVCPSIVVGIWADLLTEGRKKDMKPSQEIPPTILISCKIKKPFSFCPFFEDILGHWSEKQTPNHCFLPYLNP